MKKINGYLVILTCVSQVAEFCAFAAGGIIYEKFGPKMGFSSMFTLSAIGSIMLFLYHDNIILIPFFVAMAKFGISATLN